MRFYDGKETVLQVTRPRGSTMRSRATFSFSLFSFFDSPRPTFLLVPPSSSSLFLPRPAQFRSLKIRRSFFIDSDESVSDQPTDQPTNRRTDKVSYRDARTHLTRVVGLSNSFNISGILTHFSLIWDSYSFLKFDA